LAYRIFLKPSAEKELANIDKPNRKKIVEAINKLKINPMLKGNYLHGTFTGFLRIRVGNYRVIYSVTADTVLVVIVGHRKEVYR
jgi:mRNA interferase RelE/StbE